MNNQYIRFYKFFFINQEKPLIMEAEDRNGANRMLKELSQKSNGRINLNHVIDMRMEIPIAGISKKMKNGTLMIWNGTDETTDGWMTKEEYEKKNSINKH